MLSQRRDAAISGVLRKRACGDKDKLRGRRRLEARAAIWRKEEEPKRARERPQECVRGAKREEVPAVAMGTGKAKNKRARS